jgi:SAM-dependent methyltransferase
MNALKFIRRGALALGLVMIAASAFAQQTQKEFEPYSGQPGKDVVWVPTPEATVNKMLDMAKVTAQDFVVDLGSGDGRTVIAAAKRGARAMGIEYNPDMVTLAQRRAKEAGVTDRATIVRGDIFESDFSKATVITLFLLPDLNVKLRPIILKMRPGTRVVSNSFRMGEWEPEEVASVEDCQSWCTALLWIVPAQVDGAWKTAGGNLTFKQTFQMVSGMLGSQPITEGKLTGDQITFKVGNATYTGRVEGNSIKGTITGGPGGSWSATR